MELDALVRDLHRCHRSNRDRPRGEASTVAVDDQQLIEATDVDVRCVAIVWRDGDRPRLTLMGVAEFEAAAVMRSTLTLLEDACVDLVDLEGFDDDPDDDDA